ncbi:MAG: 50S ribosomal protein L22 [Actinomycetota bacterium]|nr:50S ribosomal protein L22 [Actinomycetota bacterium]
MPGLKTNERSGTRAVVRHVRVSPSKARAVLDLIRNESYGRAAEILAFSERAVSDVIAKCLDSAVANAEHNDEIPAEELYVSACFADEGPTMKRWRPRARGRATRINKRTSHITIIVSRYGAEDLEVMRERELAKGRASSSAQAAESRRQRVERSRAAAEAEAHDHDHDHEDEIADEQVEDEVVEVPADEQAEDVEDVAVVEDEVVEVTDEEQVEDVEAEEVPADEQVADEQEEEAN